MTGRSVGLPTAPLEQSHVLLWVGVCQKAPGFLNHMFMLSTRWWSDIWNKEKLLGPWNEFVFVSRTDVLSHPSIFCLKTFLFYRLGIPPARRHFAIRVQSDQRAKCTWGVGVTWGHLACWHHQNPLDPKIYVCPGAIYSKWGAFDTCPCLCSVGGASSAVGCQQELSWNLPHWALL